MLQEYHWAVFITALIIPGGLLALGTYHLIKLGIRLRLQRESESERLEEVCAGVIYDNVIYLEKRVEDK